MALYNGDSLMGGIYRGILLSDGSEDVRVYIPGMDVECPLKNDKTLNSELYSKNKNSYPIARWGTSDLTSMSSQLNGLACWIIFETGNLRYPVVIGYFADEFVNGLGGYSGSGNIFYNLVEKEVFDGVQPITDLKYLILHTSGCNSIDQLIEVLSNDKNSVHASADDSAVYKLIKGDWKQMCYHVHDLNPYTIGLEMIESKHVKWNNNMTGIADESYFKNHLNEIIEYHDKVYDNAVKFMADMSLRYKVPISNIISHNEANSKGANTDHRDPEELWEYFQKYTNDNKWTMNEFRNAVKKCQETQSSVDHSNWCYPLSKKHTLDPMTDGRAFGASRNNGTRAHAGIDLIVPPGTKVLACTDGEIIEYNSGFFDITDALLVKNSNGTYVIYGELRSSLRTGNIKKGQEIGQIVANSSGSSMLHFEVYRGDGTGHLLDHQSNYKYVPERAYNRRNDLCDPTFVKNLPMK